MVYSQKILLKIYGLKLAQLLGQPCHFYARARAPEVAGGGDARAVRDDGEVADLPVRVPADGLAVGAHCPGQKPPFLVFTRPARPYKTPIQNRFIYENAEVA